MKQFIFPVVFALLTAAPILAQIIAPEPIRIAPTGITQVQLNPGVNYTIEIRPLTTTVPTLNVSSLPAGVNIAPPQIGQDGVVRYSVSVDEHANPGMTEFKVTTAGTEKKSPDLIVKSPSPPRTEPEIHAHSAHTDHEVEKGLWGDISEWGNYLCGSAILIFIVTALLVELYARIRK